MHDGMPYGRNQGQGQGHSSEVDRQSPTGLIFNICELSFNRDVAHCWRAFDMSNKYYLLTYLIYATFSFSLFVVDAWLLSLCMLLHSIASSVAGP